MRRFALWACALWLVVVPAVAQTAPSAKHTVTLPDAGTYSLWVQARSGAVSVLPMTVSHKASVTLPNVPAGDTLYVLDAHTGQVAARPVPASGPLTLTVGDFKSLVPTGAPAVSVPAPHPSPAPAPPPPTNGAAQFFSWLLGLIVAAAVAWVLIQLVRTRGEPLIALARRVGVDVPDPKPLDPEADNAAMPVYEAPRSHVVEKIPDEAGAPPPIPSRPSAPNAGGVGARSPLAPPLSGAGGGNSGVPQLVGLEGLAAGSTFALTDPDVTVGREGTNGIVLAETTVSRRHARFSRGPEGAIVLTDEGSANGVFVNGQRVQQATLVPGDQIQIGDNYFRFEA